MPFDAQAFERAKLGPRTATLEVPALAAWFDAGEKPEWTVRGLTASEMHEATEAGKYRATTESILRALAQREDQVQAVREAIGLPGQQVPGEIVKRQEMLRFGSVTPAIDLSVSVKLCEQFPVEFMQLTNEILLLTGRGGIDLEKPAAASQTTPASPSP